MKLFLVFLLFSLISLSHSTEEEDASLLLYFANSEESDIRKGKDFMKNLDENTQKGKENDETTIVPDLNIGLPENEDWVLYPAENSGAASNNNDQLNVIDNEQIMAYIENEINDEISSNNTIKEPSYEKNKKILQSASENKKNPYVEDIIFYILSRLCYETRIHKRKIGQTYFGHQIYGDERKEFRKRFNIEENSVNNNKKFSSIDNYFHQKRIKPQKRCLPNISKRMAIKNVAYWETRAKKHPDFKELKDMTDIMLNTSEKASLSQAALFYMLSRLCYEIRIEKKHINQNHFGDEIYGDDKKEFRKKFDIRESYVNDNRQYTSIRNYFNQKQRKKEKRCLEHITEKLATGNIAYWEKEVRNHLDFEELKNMTDILLRNSEKVLAEEAAIYYLLSRLCYERRIEKKDIKIVEFGNQIYADDKKEFRIKFGIRESSINSNKQYASIKNYFNQKKRRKEKKCPKDITEKIATENIVYWETEIKKHQDFEELRNMADIALTISSGNTPFNI